MTLSIKEESLDLMILLTRASSSLKCCLHASFSGMLWEADEGFVLSRFLAFPFHAKSKIYGGALLSASVNWQQGFSVQNIRRLRYILKLGKLVHYLIEIHNCLHYISLRLWFKSPMEFKRIRRDST